MTIGSSIRQALGLALLISPLFAGNEKNFTYLALGDSVAFGLDISLIPTGPNQPAPSADRFTGYPEIFAEMEHLLKSQKMVNAACPGDASASFYIPGAPDNRCRDYKAAFGIHTNYPGTQLSFALSKLATNKHINLVTLQIGGDDLQLLEIRCTTPAPYPSFAACVGALLAGVLQAYGQNLFAILTAIRAEYDGTLVLVKYYSPNTDPLFIQAISALNDVMTQIGSMFGARFADPFTAFQVAAAAFPGANGDPCKAGLLLHLTPTTCDVHPSPIGQTLIALSIQAAIGAKH